MDHHHIKNYHGDCRLGCQWTAMCKMLPCNVIYIYIYYLCCRCMWCLPTPFNSATLLVSCLVHVYTHRGLAYTYLTRVVSCNSTHWEIWRSWVSTLNTNYFTTTHPPLVLFSPIGWLAMHSFGWFKWAQMTYWTGFVARSWPFSLPSFVLFPHMLSVTNSVHIYIRKHAWFHYWWVITYNVWFVRSLSCWSIHNPTF